MGVDSRRFTGTLVLQATTLKPHQVQEGPTAEVVDTTTEAAKDVESETEGVEVVEELPDGLKKNPYKTKPLTHEMWIECH